MIRGLDYHLTDETFPFEFNDFKKQIEYSNYTDTPKRGVYDRIIHDSDVVHINIHLDQSITFIVIAQ